MTVYRKPGWCGCTGKRPGEPACPCRLHALAKIIADGREGERLEREAGMRFNAVADTRASMEWLKTNDPERIETARQSTETEP